MNELAWVPSRCLLVGVVLLCVLGRVAVFADDIKANDTPDVQAGPMPLDSRAAKTAADAEVPGDDAAIARFWERLRSIEPEQMNLDPPTEEHDLDYWINVAIECRDEFKTLISEGDLDARLVGFVDGFGRYGPEADLRWALCCSNTFPVATSEPKTDPENWGELGRRIHQLNESVCGALVKRMLRDQTFRSRYLHFVLWGPMLRTSGGEYRGLTGTDLAFLVRRLVEDRKRSGERNKWYLRRNIIMLISLTGRHDLLAEAAPEEIDRIDLVWRRWLDANFVALQPAENGLSWEESPDDQFRQRFGVIPPDMDLFRGAGVIPRLSVPESPLPDAEKWVRPNRRLFRELIEEVAIGAVPVRDAKD